MSAAYGIGWATDSGGSTAVVGANYLCGEDFAYHSGPDGLIDWDDIDGEDQS